MEDARARRLLSRIMDSVFLLSIYRPFLKVSEDSGLGGWTVRAVVFITFYLLEKEIYIKSREYKIYIIKYGII